MTLRRPASALPAILPFASGQWLIRRRVHAIMQRVVRQRCKSDRDFRLQLASYIKDHYVF